VSRPISRRIKEQPGGRTEVRRGGTLGALQRSRGKRIPPKPASKRKGGVFDQRNTGKQGAKRRMNGGPGKVERRAARCRRSIGRDARCALGRKSPDEREGPNEREQTRKSISDQKKKKEGKEGENALGSQSSKTSSGVKGGRGGRSGGHENPNRGDLFAEQVKNGSKINRRAHQEQAGAGLLI